MVKTKCEVYSRVVGYIRPIQQWNDGKRAEFHKRKTFDANKALGKYASMPEVCKEVIATTPNSLHLLNKN